jgi:2-phosphoglycolate phosphatase
MRAQLGWSHPPFEIPAELGAAWDARASGKALQAGWAERFAAYARAHPELGAEFLRRMQGDLPPGFDAQVAQVLPRLAADAQAVATRRASQLALNAFAPGLPELFGGSADLTGSNLTDFTGHVAAGRDRPGNHLSYGVREFGMAAIMNGIALHGGLIPYAGTFLTFSDYSRNAIRMAALMKRRVIHVFTHDSIGLGEDGPTHQSVEHVPSLRIIPNLDVWRPADTLETAVAWASALKRRDGPSVLALSRQTLPVAAQAQHAAGIARGGYVLSDRQGARELLRQALRHHDVDGGESPSVDAAWAGFKRDCAAACGTRSAPYPGVVSTLDALQAQGMRLALITNKESVLTQRVLAAHRLTSYFDLIVAGDTLPVRKPDPAVLRHALDTFGVEADDALFIGDSAIDVQAARNAGVPVWAVSYGYDSAALRDDHAPDRLVDSLDALLMHPTHITLS